LIDIPRFEVHSKVVQPVLLSLSKKDKAIFYSHLDTMSLIERTVLRAGYHCHFTQGFNPKPVIEFANPLPLGLSSEDEVIRLHVMNYDNCERFVDSLNRYLPSGFVVNRSEALSPWETGKKKVSLMSLFWGSDFIVEGLDSVSEGRAVEKDLLSAVASGRGGDGADEAESETVSNNDPLCTVNRVDRGLLIRFRFVERKGASLLRYLSGLLGFNPLTEGVTIMRKKSLATSETGAPVSYFEYPF
jgi:hypothetical protein